MLTLIYGGSGSGKSEYAEELVGNLTSTGEKKIYLATMECYGEEGKRRVQRHRSMREGKGFVTIEKTKDVGDIIFHQDENVLLECMSNLVANEMFSENAANENVAIKNNGTEDATIENIGTKNTETENVAIKNLSDKIIRDVEKIKASTKNLIIVSNNIFDDGICYDDSTEEYKKLLADVNVRLAKIADSVVEVVVGIPITLK